MTNIRMKALTTVHVSSAQADNLEKGNEFTVSETEAKELEARGLAERVEAKAEPAPDNKMEPAPANKAKAPAKKKGD